jgi:Na+-transporting methylmalonyl-CoA/oxaloacetate decarboxylase gamma subunit
MENLGFGQILLLILFILVLLINFVMRRVRKPVESETPADEPVLDTPRRAQATPAPLPTPHASRNRVRELQAPIVLTPLSRGRFSKRSLLGSTHDVRRGIIIMTILGPCRAFDPPN